MTKIKVSKKENKFTIESIQKRKKDYLKETINLADLVVNKLYVSDIVSINRSNNFKILFDEIVENDEYEGDTHLLVYTKERKIFYQLTNKNIYARLVQVKRKILKICFNRHFVIFIYIAYIYNPYKLRIGKQSFHLDSLNYKNIKLNSYSNKKLSVLQILKNMHMSSFNVNNLLAKNAEINNSIMIKLKIDNIENCYYLSKKNKKIVDKRKYYVPMYSKYTKDHAIQLRRSNTGNIIFVRRPKEAIEYNFLFRFKESKVVQILLLLVAKIFKLFNKNIINLYFEKLCSKAEEGTIELTKYAQSSSKSKNYFIINKNSDYYENISKYKFVITQFSLKYYILYYMSDNFISTEAPLHVTIMRSNNKIFRKKLTSKKNVFLQHGIIYMKNLGKVSTFMQGKEGQCNYIVASSQKEAEVICEDFQMSEDQVLITGLGMFSDIEYNHINEQSKDIVTVMLTWKIYEEHLTDFEQSSYYKNTVEIYNKLCKHFDKKNINIVAHPKVYEALLKTNLKDSMWQGKISDILKETKLLITDYSSVCYNSFYQGSGVIFYHEDLKLYEKVQGKLLPNEDEYIGKRVFSLEELEIELSKVVKNKKIDLEKLRLKEYIENYKEINEFSDGENIKRIYNKLIEKNIV